MKFALLALQIAVASAYVIVDPNNLPHRSEKGQTGYNDCGTKDSKSASCQTLHVNSIDDFCLFAPPKKATIGDTESIEVSYCTKKGHGSRLMPKGVVKSAHFIRTPNYIQITGTGDFTKINIPKGDQGGELDPHGATGAGNPVGGIVLTQVSNGKNIQLPEWTQFISDTEFCIRACYPGPSAWQSCNHIYDVMGCYWNMPGNYKPGFDTCQADSTRWPMGLYKAGSGTSTFHQGAAKTPGPAAAPKSSQCVKASPPGASY